MTISFSGLASGLDTSSWVESLVAIKQEKVTALEEELTEIKSKQNTLSTTKTAFTTLRSAIEKITDAKFSGSYDLFANNKATSSDESVFTATADSSALRQSYDIVVNRLATCTKATSINTASAVADEDTKLSDLGVTSGKFSVYLDGSNVGVDITSDMTLGEFISELDKKGVSVTVDDNGKMTFAAKDSSKSINIGATTDESNMLSLFGLSKQDDGTYTSSNSLYKVNSSTVLTDENAGFNSKITEGTFKIGNATFTIDEDTTLSSLITSINTNTDAQAKAYWDNATGKLSITSTVEGASYINIEAGTSNFTDVMGLTQTERDDEGNITSTKMYIEAQELGDNALFSINGTNMVSTSNTVKSDVSRLTGVTLVLNKTSEDEEGNIQSSTLKVEQDASELTEALSSFVSAYNNVISTIDTVTASGADLQRESSLTSYKNTVHSYVNGSSSNEGIYKLLSEIGISTGDADSTNLSTDTSSLYLDEDTLAKALMDDPESVKEILTGDGGILTMVEDATEQMLQVTTGYFDIKSSTLKSDYSNMQTKITTQQSKVDAYQTQLENKFYQMELAISEMQQNYSNFLSSDS